MILSRIDVDDDDSVTFLVKVSKSEIAALASDADQSMLVGDGSVHDTLDALSLIAYRLEKKGG